jgi:hypothetical protein
MHRARVMARDVSGGGASCNGHTGCVYHKLGQSSCVAHIMGAWAWDAGNYEGHP